MVELLPNGKTRFAFVRPTDETVFLVGDFNNWDESSHPMRRDADGTHVLDLELKAGEYEYKFLVGHVWHNDYNAHKYVPNPWGSENSVAVIPGAAPRRRRAAPAHTGHQEQAST
jgi:1,4-alpha-glucan branching enzyme